MIRNKTYNNVINTLKNVGRIHKQITTVTTGDIYDIDLSKNTLFPLMHINPVNVSNGETFLTYNFQIFIMDLVSQDANWKQSNFQSAAFLNNEQEVLSTNLQVCVDIVAMLTNAVQQSEQGIDNIDEPIYFDSAQTNFEPFTERFDNLLTGWVFNISVDVNNDFQSCNIPIIKAGKGQGE
jgi:hypothetical protein